MFSVDNKLNNIGDISIAPVVVSAAIPLLKKIRFKKRKKKKKVTPTAPAAAMPIVPELTTEGLAKYLPYIVIGGVGIIALMMLTDKKIAAAPAIAA